MCEVCSSFFFPLPLLGSFHKSVLAAVKKAPPRTAQSSPKSIIRNTPKTHTNTHTPHPSPKINPSSGKDEVLDLLQSGGRPPAFDQTEGSKCSVWRRPEEGHHHGGKEHYFESSSHGCSSSCCWPVFDWLKFGSWSVEASCKRTLQEHRKRRRANHVAPGRARCRFFWPYTGSFCLPFIRDF